MTTPTLRHTAVLFDAYPHVYGGAQRTDHLLARALPALGWDLEVIVPADGTFPARLRAEGLPVTVIEAPPSLRAYGRVTTGAARLRAALALPRYWARLTRALRHRHPDVVHVVDHRGLVLAGWPARLSGARVIWHVQALDPTARLNRWGARLAHCTVVPTETVVAKLPGLGRPRDLRAVPNVVPDEVRHALLPPLAADPLIVTTARLHPDKGLDLLIDAMAIVRPEVPDAQLRVIGGPQDGFEPLAAELEAQAARLGVADAVELVGFIDRPDELVQAARCYVQPARERTEILPLALLEAMAAGAAVVATDVGGVRDVVHDDETGLLVPPGDARVLAAALVRVLRDDALAHRLRTAAAVLVDEPRFHVAGLVEAMLAAYEGRPAPGDGGTARG
jgi:glycosyltransferase involved in cell wall biosynthesis